MAAWEIVVEAAFGVGAVLCFLNCWRLARR